VASLEAPHSDPITQANRRLTKLLRDLDDFIGESQTLVSRTASKWEAPELSNELDAIGRSVREELHAAGRLIDDLPCESSRGRIVPEEMAS
jgi:hypothetical protein